MRLRALGMTSLAAVVLLTASPTDDVSAAGPDLAPATTAVAATPTSAIADPTTITLGPTSAAAPALASRIGETAIGQTSTGATDPTPTPTATPPAAPATVPAAQVVVAFARSHLRAPYRHFATGPSSFDCSGLMWRVFKEAGLGRKVSSRSARAIYQSYLRRGLASRRNPQVGDLVVWGRGSHVGVYIGNGYAISAIVQGVRVHRVRAMLTPFTAYLHTHLSGVVRPAWELQLAKHMRSLRHTTRAVFLRVDASGTSATAGSLRSGTRFVVLARRRDAGGRWWLEALTFTGRTGWVPLTATAR
jgi:cell wall-associated NlpC family hydrolase